MRKLAVGASKKQRRRLTEYRFEDKFGNALAELGVRNHHACPDWDKGIPDRYIFGGGKWMEFKSLAYDRSVMPWNAFSVDQRKNIRDCIKHGDRVWVCILLCHEDDGDNDRVMLMEWPEFEACYERVSLQRQEIISRFPIVNRRDNESLKAFIRRHFACR
jgi:hypothetical protein